MDLAGGAVDIDSGWTGSLNAANFGATDWQSVLETGSNWTLDGAAIDASSFAANFEVTNGGQTLSAVPEPATLGLIMAFGGGVLFIRRRFMI